MGSANVSISGGVLPSAEFHNSNINASLNSGSHVHGTGDEWKR